MVRRIIFAAAAAVFAFAARPLAAQALAQQSSVAASPQQKSPVDSEKKSGERTEAPPTHAEILAANAVEGARYSNRALGISFEIPDKMGVESASATKETEDAGHRAAHRTDPASDPAHQQAETQTIHLLSLADRSAGAASSPAEILVLAYDLGAEKFSNEDIVAGISSGMSAEPGDWQVTDAPHAQEYGGKKFWQQGLKGVIRFGSHSISVYVEILATQCRGYAIAWTVSAATQERLDALAKFFPTIKFSPECPSPAN